jgi:hypothetical protein
MEVVDTLAVFIEQQWWWLVVCGLDPVREQSTLVSLIPEVLVQIGVCDLFQRVNLVCGD